MVSPVYKLIIKSLHPSIICNIKVFLIITMLTPDMLNVTLNLKNKLMCKPAIQWNSPPVSVSRAKSSVPLREGSWSSSLSKSTGSPASCNKVRFSPVCSGRYSSTSLSVSAQSFPR